MEDDLGGTWPEVLYTGTGFLNFFYIEYTLYRHIFSVMALGRYLKKVENFKAAYGTWQGLDQAPLAS